MIERIARGTLPAKHHIALRGDDGSLRHEECLTRDGFEGAYTILYHLGRPHLSDWAPVNHGYTLPEAEPVPSLMRRHYATQNLPDLQGAACDARIPLLFNDDICINLVRPTSDDPVWMCNADGDELYFIHEGGGTLVSPMGDLRFGKHDYVIVPRGVQHRFLLDDSPTQRWLQFECTDLSIPRQWRNPTGQLRMDAPYCHRDFRAPEFSGPRDHGVRDLLVKRGNDFHGFRLHNSPLDIVGWDGTVYPVAFNIHDFQARAGLVHLPPTWHGTFTCKGGLICSFVPRMVDFHPEAIPCPYPHSSVDIDEFLYYVEGNFTSRRGVGPGSVSHHPAGILHGPHSGAYEGSIGHTRTDELAVMLDCAKPLQRTTAARVVEDTGYHSAFAG